MITHVLKVEGRDITVDNRVLYEKTSGEDRVQLVTDDEWSGLSVAVTFRGSGKTVTSEVGADGYYMIPADVQTQAGDVYAIVVGSGSDGKVLRHAVMAKPFRVIGTEPGTSDVQVSTEVSEAVRACEEAAAKANASVIDGVTVSTLGPGSEATVDVSKGKSGQSIALGIPRGDTGADGSKWYTGEGAPAIGGRVGDLYIDTETGAYYRYGEKE